MRCHCHIFHYWLPIMLSSGFLHFFHQSSLDNFLILAYVVYIVCLAHFLMIVINKLWHLSSLWGPFGMVEHQVLSLQVTS
jgi:hypothetical protein